MVDGEQLQRIVRETGLEDDPEAQKLLRRAATTENQHLRDQIKKRLIQKAAEKTQHPFNENPPQNSPLNSIYLGKTQNQDRVYTLKEEQFSQHILTTGQSGAGKTTLFYNLMTQISKPFWAFDRKQDYRHLTNQMDDLLVLPWKTLRFNPLKPPPGVDPDKWAQVFTEIFSHATSLLSGSKNFLLKHIINLYIDFNLYQEDPPLYPTLFELKASIEQDNINYTRKSSNYQDTVLNRIEPILLTAESTFNCNTGYPIQDLIQRNVVFEFEGLNRDIQRFLQEILFAYTYEYQLAQNKRTGELDLVIFFDEGKQAFSVYLEQQTASGIPEIDDLTARARQMGIGLVVGDQEASKLTDSLKANTKTKILLPVGDQKQFQAISESMNLDRRQQDFAKTLDTGQAVIQTGNREPVPVDLLNYQVEQDVDDETLRETQEQKWQDLEYEEREIQNNPFYQKHGNDRTTLDDF